jgi:hypothetical protein
VAGLSTGTRAFSASDTIVKATPAKARPGWMAISRWASVSTIVVSEVDCEVSDTENRTTSSAGSARKPMSISRRAPSVPKAVPMSIAASEMNTRASANRPTSAIASAARDSGRSVESVGTMEHASAMQPNTMYGAERNIDEACSAITDSLLNSLCST